MSQKGINRVRAIISSIQEARIELIAGDAEDMRLAGMLLKMHEIESMEFARILSDPRTNAMAKADQQRRANHWDRRLGGVRLPLNRSRLRPGEKGAE